MTKLPRALTTISFCLVLGSFLVAWSISSAGRDPQTQQNGNPTRAKTLREIAGERDVEREVREGHFGKEYSDLRRLAKDCDAIVLGRILEEEGYFSGDNDITTKYKVDVQRIMKDGTLEAAQVSQSLGKAFPAPLTTPLSFTRFGGTVHLNGHRASLSTKGGDLLTSGKTYILFLEWTGRNYHIAGGMSGAILVNDTARVKPLGSNQTLQIKYADLGLEAFIAEVLKAPTQ